MNERRNRPQRPQRPARAVPQEPVEENEGQLEGRNAIQEALKSGRTIDKLFVASGDTDKGLQRLAAQAKEAGAVVVPVDRRKLDTMSFTRSHQGVIALCAAHDYYTIDDILEEAASRGQAPLIVICDELSDPHNLGAILRSAECAGAHGVIIPPTSQDFQPSCKAPAICRFFWKRRLSWRAEKSLSPPATLFRRSTSRGCNTCCRCV